jgi:hypothetical protein
MPNRKVVNLNPACCKLSIKKTSPQLAPPSTWGAFSEVLSHPTIQRRYKLSEAASSISLRIFQSFFPASAFSSKPVASTLSAIYRVDSSASAAKISSVSLIGRAGSASSACYASPAPSSAAEYTSRSARVAASIRGHDSERGGKKSLLIIIVLLSRFNQPGLLFDLNPQFLLAGEKLQIL